MQNAPTSLYKCIWNQTPNQIISIVKNIPQAEIIYFAYPFYTKTNTFEYLKFRPDNKYLTVMQAK